MTSFTATFRVYGDPKGQPRPRAASHGGHARLYDPGTAKPWKEAIVIAARPSAPPEPIGVPVSVSITLWLPRPASRSRKKDHDGELWAPKKPDVDNAEKAVFDALVAMGFIADDALIVENRTSKRYHAKNSAPGALITIRTIEGNP